MREEAEQRDTDDPGNLSDHRYARGYTISLDQRPAPKAGWKLDRVGHVFVTRDPRVPLVSGQGPIHFVAALGMIWDARYPDRTSQDVVDSVLAALARSEDAFLDHLDVLSGRFVLVYGTADTVSVCGDATVMKSIIYSASHPGFVASHGSIVAEAIGAPKCPAAKAIMAAPQWKMPQSRYLAGSITEWDGVHFLTANTVLSLTDGKVKRFWPRRAITRLGVDEAVDIVNDLMHREMSWLASQCRPLVTSLTAGIDSRMAFSITKSWPDIEYFTYSDGESPAHRADAEVAGEMASALGLRHDILPINKQEERTIVNIIKENNRISHLPFVASAYLRRFPQNAIHVRSNLAEIGRVFYRRHFKGNCRDAVEMAKAWRRMPEAPAAIRAFERWDDLVGFSGAVGEKTGLDAADLFYWEHRMSCWHGRVVCESDIAFDTTSLFNNRKILSALLGVPRQKRIDAEVFVGVIERNAPELLRWPINGVSLR